MRKLARTIAKELKTANRCAVYSPELARVWPGNEIRRQKGIEKFARAHGWRVGYYKRAFVATFVKEPPSKRN